MSKDSRHNANATIILAVLFIAFSGNCRAVGPGEFADFEDAFLGDWSHSGTAAFLTNPDGCGWGGSWGNSRCLQKISTGIAGPNGRMMIFNNMEWKGDYRAPDIDALRMRVRNLTSDSPLHLRIGITNGTTCYVSPPQSPLDSGVPPLTDPMQFVEFDLHAVNVLVTDGPECTGPVVADPSEVLANATQLRIFSAVGDSWQGDSVNATLHVDNIRAISKLGTEWRWIGFKRDADQVCPTPDSPAESAGSDWAVGHLFGNPTEPDPTVGSNASLPAALRNWCVFTYPVALTADRFATERIEALVDGTPEPGFFVGALLSVEPDFLGTTPPSASGGRSKGSSGVSDDQDSDDDSVPDALDNCILEANTDQRDSNLDGFGNLCDADLNDDCAVNFLDLGIMKQVFFSQDDDADLNGDSSVNFLDLGLMKALFFQQPGPSGIASCNQETPARDLAAPDARSSQRGGPVSLEATLYDRLAAQFENQAGRPVGPHQAPIYVTGTFNSFKSVNRLVYDPAEKTYSVAIMLNAGNWQFRIADESSGLILGPIVDDKPIGPGVGPRPLIPTNALFALTIPIDSYYEFVIDANAFPDETLRVDKATVFPFRDRPLEPDPANLPVRLSIIDTAPDIFFGGAPESPGDSLHGLTLLHMANRLLCDSSTGFYVPGCVAEIHGAPAITFRCADQLDMQNRTLECENQINGGYAGLVGTLAQTVWAQVDDWRNADPPEGPLVLNLSLAWNPSMGGTEGSFKAMPVAVEAVAAALEDAVCRGALVVAAVGNRVNGPLSNGGATLPGAWQLRPTPSADRCMSLMGSKDDWYAGTLTYAASGIQADGTRLFNSRTPGGESQYAAYADHAAAHVADSSAPENRFAVLTGSSIATLVTSSTAAAVRHYLPNLNADDVMALVYNSGENVGRLATIDPNSPGPEVHRLQLCKAAAAALTVSACTPPDCPAIPDCPTPSLLDPVSVNADLASFGDPLVLSFEAGMMDPACNNENAHTQPDGVVVCPHITNYGQLAKVATNPAPCEQPCPSCTQSIASPGTIYIEIDDDFDGTLRDTILKCGNDTFIFPMHLTFSSGNKFVIDNVDALCDTANPVSLMFRVEDEHMTMEDLSIASPLLRIQ